ncbi:DUF2397 family protein [Streptomyces sp. NPDC056161]|uniref:DUF2397 family protein n=1 Tax=Streptomyces sp. NPDC056161 TaxID=3345732 RepID=UPI0035D8A950
MADERLFRSPAERLADWRHRWDGIVHWFAEREHSETERLQDATVTAIRSVLALLRRVTEARRGGVSRESQLRPLAQWFTSCGSDEDAHALFQAVFGLGAPRHIAVPYADPELIPGRTSWWEAEPVELARTLVQSGRTPALKGPGRIERDDDRRALLRAEQLKEQAALLLAARISAAVQRSGRHALELLPAPTAAERLTVRARRIDAALPSRGLVAELAELAERDEESAYQVSADDPPDDEGQEPAETRYPFVTDSWLRGRLKEITSEYGAGFAADLRGDPDRLLGQALELLAAMSLTARVDGGALALPLLARYRGVTARVKTRTVAGPPSRTALFADDTVNDNAEDATP